MSEHESTLKLKLESGILPDEDQKLAHRLYNIALSDGGDLNYIDSASQELIVISVTHRKNRREMQIYLSGREYIEASFQRGKNSPWQHNGARGYISSLESQISPKVFIPSREQRSNLLKKAVEIFLDRIG